MTFWNRLTQVRGIGTGVRGNLWVLGAVALLAGLLLDCSGAPHWITVPLYLASIAGWATWLWVSTREAGES